MRTLDKKEIFGGSILNPLSGIFDRSIADRVEMLFTDVETKGKKKGYLRAAEEYEKVFRSIESEYKQAKELIEAQKKMYDAQSDILIEKLEALENQKRRLERQVKLKIKAVSDKYDIPVSQVQGSLATGTLIMGPIMFYRYRERKLREAEQRGYLEAKELYENKIDELKRELSVLKSKGSVEIKKMVGMMGEILDAIAEEQMKIAELKILL